MSVFHAIGSKLRATLGWRKIAGGREVAGISTMSCHIFAVDHFAVKVQTLTKPIPVGKLKS